MRLISNRNTPSTQSTQREKKGFPKQTTVLWKEYMLLMTDDDGQSYANKCLNLEENKKYTAMHCM